MVLEIVCFEGQEEFALFQDQLGGVLENHEAGVVVCCGEDAPAGEVQDGEEGAGGTGGGGGGGEGGRQGEGEVAGEDSPGGGRVYQLQGIVGGGEQLGLLQGEVQEITLFVAQVVQEHVQLLMQNEAVRGLVHQIIFYVL